MKQGSYKIHANPGGVFDCVCDVDVSHDGETLGLEFPQLTPKDKIGPMVYACMNGADLTVRLVADDDCEWGFAWSEKDRRWILMDSPNTPAVGEERKL